MSIRPLAIGLLVALSHCSNGVPPSAPPLADGASQPPGAAAPAPLARQELELIDAIAAERRVLSGHAAAERRDVDALYDRASGGPVWLDATGRLTPQARDGLALLEESASHGLDPAVYGLAALTPAAARLDEAAPVSPTLAAQFDVRMTASVLRYFRHLHLGRVDPRTLGHQLTIPVEEHDFAEIVWSAIDGRRLSEAAREMEPPLPQYQALKAMLARYTALAGAAPEPPTFTDTVRPGERFDDVARLHRLLVTLGDLPENTPLPVEGIYDDAIRAGIVRFQQRHGLDADGVIGRGTQQALRVPPSWRARQIVLALERLRWLPDLSQGRLIAVNIPMFRLWAWDGAPSATPSLTMAVIVGRAMRTHTPVFADQMEYVIFRPYWNVPPSILRNESIPAIRRNPEYLARERLEIVRGQADSAAVLAPTPENIAALGTGDVRLRQRPGPGNALGLVKFMFPNQNDVYMHDTPSPQLFQKSRRDFSHGCIRVENPVGLAEWTLGRDPSWTRERIVAAMQGENNRRVNLTAPIQVIIFYTTAAVVPEDGSLHFAEDVYGHDARLDKVL
jgi:murein L,D-transpeptidase YcbB/YkuD